MHQKVLIDNNSAKFVEFMSKEHYAELRKRMSYLPEDYFFRDSFAKFHKDGRKNLLKGSIFPVGLLSIFKRFCIDFGYELEIEFVETNKVKNPIEFLPPKYKINTKFELRDYQEDAIVAAMKEKHGVIQAPTGSGKSLIMARLVDHIDEYPALICLMSLDLLEQTIKHYENYLGVEIGRIGNGKFDIKPITVGMVQSIAAAIKNKDQSVIRYLGSVKTLLIDECHHQVADTVKKISYSCGGATYKIGFSGTVYRDNADDLEIEAALGPIIYRVSIGTLVERGYLVKPRIYMFHLPKKLYKSDKAVVKYSDIISDYVESSYERNQIIAKLVNCLHDDGRITLVLVNRIEHGELLESMIKDSVFVHGSTPSAERTRIFDAFSKKQFKTLIASAIIDEGWDCPVVDSLILAHPYKSLVKAYQRIGRGLRSHPGKTDVIVVDFADDVKYLKDHAKRRMKIYRSEPSFEIVENTLEM